jgi:hypothetical protein
MHNVILISNDDIAHQSCSIKMAQQLLHHGLASIVKFYPYTLKLKKPFQPKDPFEGAYIPEGPCGMPPALSKQMKLRKEEAI